MTPVDHESEAVRRALAWYSIPWGLLVLSAAGWYTDTPALFVVSAPLFLVLAPIALVAMLRARRHLTTLARLGLLVSGLGLLAAWCVEAWLMYLLVALSLSPPRLF